MEQDVIKFARAGGPPRNWHRLEILLDGMPLRDVIDADVILGVVTVYKRDANGKLVADGDRNATELRRGHVVIREAPASWAAPSRKE